MSRSTSCFLALLALPLLAAGCSPPADLSLRWPEGAALVATLDSRWKISIDVPPGAKKKRELVQSRGFTFRITLAERLADGGLALDVAIEALRYRNESPDGVIEYDSRKPGDNRPPVVRALEAARGASFGVRLAPGGAVRAVERWQPVLDRMVKAFGVESSVGRRSFRLNYDATAIRELFTYVVAAPRPSEPLEPGGSWGGEDRISRGYPCRIQRRLRYRGETSGERLVSESSVVEPNREAAIDLGSASLQIDARGEQEGEAALDPGDGWPRRGSWTRRLAGNLIREGGGIAVTPFAAKALFTLSLERRPLQAKPGS